MANYVFVRTSDDLYDLRKDGRNVDVDVEVSPSGIDDALRRARAGTGDTVTVERPGGRHLTLTLTKGRWR